MYVRRNKEDEAQLKKKKKLASQKDESSPQFSAAEKCIPVYL